jgi:hypothetical protein
MRMCMPACTTCTYHVPNCYGLRTTYYVLCTYRVLTACVLPHSLTHPISPVYEDISSHEIKTGTEWDDLGESELMEWLRNGTVLSTSNPVPNHTPDATPMPSLRLPPPPVPPIPTSTLALTLTRHRLQQVLLQPPRPESIALVPAMDTHRRQRSLFITLTLTRPLTPTLPNPNRYPNPYPYP